MNEMIFDKNKNSHWRTDFQEATEILLQNGYILKTYNEEDLVIIQYDFANENYADHFLYWLNINEADNMDSYRRAKIETNSSDT